MWFEVDSCRNHDATATFKSNTNVNEQSQRNETNIINKYDLYKVATTAASLSLSPLPSMYLNTIDTYIVIQA